MSTFEREGYRWRETYFVLFEACRRPSMKQVERLLRDLSPRFQLTGAVADEDGRFESLTVLSPDDYAALDISYIAGEEVQEQAAALYQEMKSPTMDKEERAKLERLKKCDARFDLLHFEQVTAGSTEEEMDEMLDPSALLIVLESLVDLTRGTGIDPQSGTIL